MKLVDRGTSFGMRADDAMGTEVHVFEGRVQLSDLEANQAGSLNRELTAGQGLRVSKNDSEAELRANPAEFAGEDEIERLSVVSLRDRFQRWREFSRALRRDARLIAYYPFDRDSAEPRQLLNRAGQEDRSLTGSMVGCAWSQGRWPGKDALELKRPGDRIRIHVPGTTNR